MTKDTIPEGRGLEAKGSTTSEAPRPGAVRADITPTGGERTDAGTTQPDAPGGAAPGEGTKRFDPWRFGAHTMPPELRRELVSTTLPDANPAWLYRSPAEEGEAPHVPEEQATEGELIGARESPEPHVAESPPREAEGRSGSTLRLVRERHAPSKAWFFAAALALIICVVVALVATVGSPEPSQAPASEPLPAVADVPRAEPLPLAPAPAIATTSARASSPVEPAPAPPAPRAVKPPPAKSPPAQPEAAPERKPIADADRKAPPPEPERARPTRPKLPDDLEAPLFPPSK